MLRFLLRRFLWFGITFWAYLETRSVLATSFLGGAYMLGMAVLGVPFGSSLRARACATTTSTAGSGPRRGGWRPS